MNCRAAILPERPTMPTARQRFEKINELAVTLFDRLETSSSMAEFKLRVMEIQHIACIGAAYERRRERGES